LLSREGRLNRIKWGNRIDKIVLVLIRKLNIIVLLQDNYMKKWAELKLLTRVKQV
jgi:hypothetical protein